MNVLIISAILGVIMLFSGVLLKQASFLRFIAVVGMAGLFVVNILEIAGISFFKIDIPS